jgi:hypothetical protein
MEISLNEQSINLLDIVRAYSILKFKGQDYFFKHFLVLEILELERKEFLDVESAVKSGIKREGDILKEAIKSGAWSVKEEEDIISKEWMIKKSTLSLEKIKDPSQRKFFNGQIEDQRKSLAELKKKKSSITAYSAEYLAEVKKIKRMIRYHVFFDKEMQNAVEDPQLREDLAPELFKRYADLNNREKVLRASFDGGFFEIFVPQSKNPMSLFGVNFSNITLFQKNLLVLSNALLNKMKSTTIPDEISDDPSKILEYEEPEEKDGNVTHGLDDLKSKMKARGGELKAEDFLT